MISVFYQGFHDFGYFLFSRRIVFLPDIKGHIQTCIFVEHRSAVALNGKAVLIQLIQIPAYGFLRYLEFLTQFADNNLLILLKLFKNQISSLYR